MVDAAHPRPISVVGCPVSAAACYSKFEESDVRPPRGGGSYALSMRGAVAAVNRNSAEAGAWALREGGTCVDGRTRGERSLRSSRRATDRCLRGGAEFLLLRSRPAGRSSSTASSPCPSEARGEMDEVEIDFADASTQIFHIGEASVAVPGSRPGLIEAQRAAGPPALGNAFAGSSSPPLRSRRRPPSRSSTRSSRRSSSARSGSTCLWDGRCDRRHRRRPNIAPLARRARRGAHPAASRARPGHPVLRHRGTGAGRGDLCRSHDFHDADPVDRRHGRADRARDARPSVTGGRPARPTRRAPWRRRWQRHTEAKARERSTADGNHTRVRGRLGRCSGRALVDPRVGLGRLPPRLSAQQHARRARRDRSRDPRSGDTAPEHDDPDARRRRRRKARGSSPAVPDRSASPGDHAGGRGGRRPWPPGRRGDLPSTPACRRWNRPRGGRVGRASGGRP